MIARPPARQPASQRTACLLVFLRSPLPLQMPFLSLFFSPSLFPFPLILTLLFTLCPAPFSFHSLYWSSLPVSISSSSLSFSHFLNCSPLSLSFVCLFLYLSYSPPTSSPAATCYPSSISSTSSSPSPYAGPRNLPGFFVLLIFHRSYHHLKFIFPASLRPSSPHS